MVVEYHEYREVMKRAREDKQQLETTVAELVALLRQGKELAEAARDATFYSGEKMKRAIADRDRILDQYDAAIAKHGGGQ